MFLLCLCYQIFDFDLPSENFIPKSGPSCFSCSPSERSHARCLRILVLFASVRINVSVLFVGISLKYALQIVTFGSVFQNTCFIIYKI
jgi:hypothetical protein